MHLDKDFSYCKKADIVGHVYFENWQRKDNENKYMNIYLSYAL